MYPNRRGMQRVNAYQRPIEISIGTQIVMNGRLKDISEKSAFVDLNNKLFIQAGDELSFKIPFKDNNRESLEISGVAVVSRISPGEGIAIYFKEFTEGSEDCLKQLLSPDY